MRVFRSAFLSLAFKAKHAQVQSQATGTGQFFADFSLMECVKDCMPGGPLDSNGDCGGIAEPWYPLFLTAKVCCMTKLSWLDPDECEANTRGATFHTNKFYVDWGSNKCVQDCDLGNGVPCKGNPPDTSGVPTQLFDNANDCCKTKIWWKTVGTCVAESTGNLFPFPPTVPSPTPPTPTVPTPTPPTTPFVPTTPVLCTANSDCNQICSAGTCVASPPSPNIPPTPPSPPTACQQCTSPSKIPDECEVEILIDQMELFVLASHELLAQWTRAAFHDAGTFDQNDNVGGANGCLMNHAPMRLQPENHFFDAPINTLQAIKDSWIAHASTCIDVSSADMLQFAIFFAITRQTGTPGLDSAKRDKLITQFDWGRPDELNCDVAWTEHLPGFEVGAGQSIPRRCTLAGKEIKEKMIEKNGFTPEEATALIGAHTIGLIRNTFGTSLSGPWVPNGADTATPEGPVFDNAYHNFLINTIVENNANDFGNNIAPFTVPFGTWFRVDPGILGPSGLDHLDTDVALAFPSLDLNDHPHFDTFSRKFAASNTDFLDTFGQALKKMGMLGVTVPLTKATSCACGTIRSRRALVTVDRSLIGYSGKLTATDMLELTKELGIAMASSDEATRFIQAGRKEEIDALTTPVYNMTTTTTSTTSPYP